jgi:signal transduction histidine kinase
MTDTNKTREQLIEELKALRAQVALPQQAEAERNQAEEHLVTARDELERQNARLEALYRVGQMVNSTLETDVILSHLTDEAMRVTHATHGQVLIAQKERGFFERRVLRGFSPQERERARTAPLPLTQGINGRVYTTCQTVHVDNVLADANYFPLIPGTRSEVAVPIIYEGRVLGNLDLQSPEVGGFRHADLDYLNALAAQVAIAIQNARLHQEARQRASHLEALHRVTLDITAQLDLDALLRTIIEAALELLDAHLGGIYLYQPERDVLEWAVSVGQMEPLGTELARGEGLSGKVWETDSSVIADDYVSWEGRAAKFERYPWKAVVGVPIRWAGEFLGVVNALADDPQRRFTDADANLLSQFATQAAVAIHNARLHKTTLERAARLAVIADIGQRTTAILEPAELLSQSVHLIQVALDYSSVHVLLIRDDELVLEATTVPSLLPRREQLRLRVGQRGITGWVAEHGQPLRVPDVSLEPRYHSVEEMKDTRSEIAVPLKVKGEVIGVLDVQSADLDTFTQTDVSTLQAIADQLAIAIDNTRLFADLETRNHELLVFADVIAHDLRGPLHLIMGHASLLSEDVDDKIPEQRISLDAIESYAHKMTDMIEQLLLLAKLRDVTEVVEHVEIEPIVEAALVRCQSHIAERGVAIAVAPDLPPALCHKLWIEEVFVNLISNAVKYIGDDNSSPHIAIRGESQAERVRYEVQDNGLGIGPEDQVRLFERFSRFHQTEAGGFGLGLFIVRQIVTKLQGEVGVASDPGEGSTFWFTLPIPN